MIRAARVIGLAATLVLVPTLPSLAQSTSSANIYVQVQGSAGPVYGYSSSLSGQLTAIPGSPFKPAGAIIGSTPTKFFTLGKTLIHSFRVASNGAIGGQLSQIAFHNYAGGECGGNVDEEDAAVLDHSGKYLYLMITNVTGSQGCAAYQTYKINSDGSFTFDGDTILNLAQGEYATRPSILGNEAFAYASASSGYSSWLTGFRRDSTGTLQLMQFRETDPAYNENFGVSGADASPAGNYLVAQLFPNDSEPPQLAVYTVDSQGNLSTTNTPATMPTSNLYNRDSVFSPSGMMFALSGENGPDNNPGNGIEIYNVNGAEPLTLYKKLLTGTPVNQIAWDKSNHLFAISWLQNTLYVFTVTSTSVTQNAALPVSSPVGMVVVNQ